MIDNVNLQSLIDVIVTNANRKGFYTPDSIIKAPLSYDYGDYRELNAELTIATLMMCVTELSEAVKAVQRGDEKNFAEELADTMIRILGICGEMKIDILTEINKKMEKNFSRENRHGLKCII